MLAAITAIEWLWWAVAWKQQLAPAPMLLPYLLMTAAIACVAVVLRVVFGRPPVGTTAPTMIAGTALVWAGASAFLPIKYAIPKLVPFWLDGPLAHTERAMLGADPWFVADRLLGWATMPLDWLYGAWLPTQSLILFIVMAAAPSAAKSRALVAYALCWLLLGVVAATLLSSVGPLFIDRLSGGTAFAALPAALHARGAWIVFAESDAMWLSFRSGHPGLAAGISAMPSIHVAISLWIALVARSLAPRVAMPALVYFAIMWIASVQLGWHYLLDGAAGAFGMLLIWIGSQRLVGGSAIQPPGSFSRDV